MTHTPWDQVKTKRVLVEISDERIRQNDQWGEQNHPDGTSITSHKRQADNRRWLCDQAAKDGKVTWKHILDEEVYEAFAETDPVKLREELIQVAAVAVAWVEAIDRRLRAAEQAAG